MPHMLLAAVHTAAAQIDCLASLALSTSDTLDQAPAMVDPLENARRAADLARIMFDQLRLVAATLHGAETQAAERLAAATDQLAA